MQIGDVGSDRILLFDVGRGEWVSAPSAQQKPKAVIRSDPIVSDLYPYKAFDLHFPRRNPVPSMSSHRLTLIAGLSLFSACARNPPPVAPIPVETISFSAQTGRDTIVEATFAGTAVSRGGWIDVVVSKTTLTFPPGSPERWRSLTIRSFVAVDYSRSGWRAPVESTPINVWRFLAFPRGAAPQSRTSITLDSALHYLIPIPPGASLATSRLGFEVEWVTLFNGYGQTEANYAISEPLAATRPPSP
jgi:hypothetical protein